MGTQAENISPYCISCIYGSGNIAEERAVRLYKPEYHEVCCKTVLPRNNSIHKIGIVEISMDIQMHIHLYIGNKYNLR